LTRQEAIGRWLLSKKKKDGTWIHGWDLPRWADHLEKGHLDEIPENRKDESIGTETAQAYAAELRNNPDKHAQEMLRAIERGEKLEEDPSGS